MLATLVALKECYCVCPVLASAMKGRLGDVSPGGVSLLKSAAVCTEQGTDLRRRFDASTEFLIKAFSYEWALYEFRYNEFD